jgi:hypothetical protein
MGAGVVMAAHALAFGTGALPAFASGDAIVVGKPAPKEPKVKEQELAEEPRETNPPKEGEKPNDGATGQSKDSGTEKPLAPKDLPSDGGPAPPLPTGKDGEAAEGGEDKRPEPSFPIKEDFIHFKSAESVSYDKGRKLLTLTGDVVIEVEETTVTADLVEVDDNSKQIYAKGHVAVWQEDDIIFGDELFLNYESKYFRITNPSGNTSSPDINGRVYFEGKNLEGTFERYVITKGRITTCEPFCGKDEYHVTSRKVIIKPNKLIMMEENYGYIKENKMFYWPLIVIPLRRDRYEQRRGPIEQNYGYNAQEGWFAKYAWTYDVTYKDELQYPLVGVAILDLMEKKGIRIGQKQDYHISDVGSGTYWWEYLFSNEKVTPRTTSSLFPGGVDPAGPSAFEQYRAPAQSGAQDSGKTPEDYRYKLEQSFHIGKKTTGSFGFERRNQYTLYRSRTNTFNSQFSLSRTAPGWTTNLTLSRNWTGSSTSGTGTTTTVRDTLNATGNFRSQFNIGKDATWSLTQTYSSNKQTGGGAADQEGTFSSDINWRRPRYTVTLGWREDIDFDDSGYLGDLRRNVNHETPNIGITLDRKIWESAISEIGNINLNFVNKQAGARNQLDQIFYGSLRTDYSKRYQLDRWNTLSTQLRFEQNVYDDGNALYIYSPSVQYEYKPRRWFNLRLGWTQTQPEGRASPVIRGGSSISSNNFTGSFSLTNHKTWRTDVRTGFDYKRSVWQNLSILQQWDPNDNFGMTLETGWDIESRSFMTANQLKTSYYSDSGNWNTFADVRFSLSKNGTGRHKKNEMAWNTIRLSYNRKFIRNWDLQVLTEQTRGRDEHLIRRLALRKTNCCTTMLFGYDSFRKEYYMQVFINAFPDKTTSARFADDEIFFDTPADYLFNPGTYTSGLGYQY